MSIDLTVCSRCNEGFEEREKLVNAGRFKSIWFYKISVLCLFTFRWTNVAPAMLCLCTVFSTIH